MGAQLVRVCSGCSAFKACGRLAISSARKRWALTPPLVTGVEIGTTSTGRADHIAPELVRRVQAFADRDRHG
jgi:hypothetical protein